MRYIVVILALIATPAFAKRTAAPVVAPVEHEGIRYVAPNRNGQVGLLEAWDIQTGTQLWAVPVFRNRIKPWLERDVQWVFIEKLEVLDGRLVVTDERGARYFVDLKTGQVEGSSMLWFLSGVLLLLLIGGSVLLLRRKVRANKAIEATPQ